MLESQWSEPQSDLTEEISFATRSAVPPNPLSFHTAFAAPRQRGVLPKVQPSQLNRSDQRVPVYWDQTVPVWHAGGGPSSSTTKRKAPASKGQGRYSRRLEGGGGESSSDTMSAENSGENSCCSSECDFGSRGDEYSTRSGDGGASVDSSKVSFDAILSMYESSLVEKSFKWSRRDWWVLGALLKPRSRSRWFKSRVHDQRRGLLPRRCAGRRQFPDGLNISVQSSASEALMGEAVVDQDEVESMRRLGVAIERTSICDGPASVTCRNSNCGSIRMRDANAIPLERRRSCDFQNYQHPLSFSTPMLTTSSA